jgi:hypothetical protein
VIFLLDVNVLLALSYDDHVHNARIRRWVSQLAAEDGHDRIIFATCPITELGFVRVGCGKAAYDTPHTFTWSVSGAPLGKVSSLGGSEPLMVPTFS